METRAGDPGAFAQFDLHRVDSPSFVVDVSDQYAAKRAALDCYVSQFRGSAAGAVPTRLNSPRFSQLIESRDAWFGAVAGVAYAEGLVVKDPILLPQL